MSDPINTEISSVNLLLCHLSLSLSFYLQLILTALKPDSITRKFICLNKTWDLPVCNVTLLTSAASFLCLNFTDMNCVKLVLVRACKWGCQQPEHNDHWSRIQECKSDWAVTLLQSTISRSFYFSRSVLMTFSILKESDEHITADLVLTELDWWVGGAGH